MNLIDVVVVLLVLVLAFRGLRRGLLREVFSFAGWLGGALAAVYLLFDLTPFLAETFRLPAAFAGLIAFTGVFLLVSTLLWLVGWLLSTLIKVTLLLRPLDKAAGLALGAVEGLVFAGILLFVLRASPLFPTARDLIDESALGPTIADTTSTLFSTVRDEAVRLRAEAEAAKKTKKKSGDAPDAGRPSPPAGD